MTKSVFKGTPRSAEGMNLTLESNTTLTDIFLDLFQRDYEANEIILIVLCALSVIFVLIGIVECYNAFFLTCQAHKTKNGYGSTCNGTCRECR